MRWQEGAGGSNSGSGGEANRHKSNNNNDNTKNSSTSSTMIARWLLPPNFVVSFITLQAGVVIASFVPTLPLRSTVSPSLLLLPPARGVIDSSRPTRLPPEAAGRTGAAGRADRRARRPLPSGSAPFLSGPVDRRRREKRKGRRPLPPGEGRGADAGGGAMPYCCCFSCCFAAATERRGTIL